MDPTANLREQLQNAQDIRKVWEEDCNDDGTLPAHRAQYVAQQADRLAELIEALNEWITKGGFLPEQWQASRKEASETMTEANEAVRPADTAKEKCSVCLAALEVGNGDNWDDLCPSCADKVSEYMDDTDASRDEAVDHFIESISRGERR